MFRMNAHLINVAIGDQEFWCLVLDRNELRDLLS